MWIKRAHLHQRLLRLARYVHDNRPWVLLQQLLLLPAPIRYNNHVAVIRLSVPFKDLIPKSISQLLFRGLVKIFASIQSSFSHGGDRVGNSQRGKTLAIIECFRSNVCDGVWDRQLCKISATIKCVVTNGDDRFWNR